MSELLAGEPVSVSQLKAARGQVVLDAQQLRVSFPTGHADRLVAVDDISLSVRAGEMLGVVGESGSGKTTVARCLVGLQAPDSGTVTLCGSLVHARRTPEQRRAAQLVFQDPYASLNPRLRIGTVLRELLSTHRLARGEAAEARCRELMGLVGLPSDALASYPSAFSGGSDSGSPSPARSLSSRRCLSPTSRSPPSTSRCRQRSLPSSPTCATGSGSGS